MSIIVYDNKHNKGLLCLTDTSLYIYICVKHFGMANIKIKLTYLLLNYLTAATCFGLYQAILYLYTVI